VLLLLLPLLLLLLLLGAWQRSSISKLAITASHLGMLVLSTPVRALCRSLSLSLYTYRERSLSVYIERESERESRRAFRVGAVYACERLVDVIQKSVTNLRLHWSYF
jgi:hypothetical protein